MAENWSPPKNSSPQSPEWEAAIDELAKKENGGLTREGAIHALKATAHLKGDLVENASQWAEKRRYNFISAMIIAAQNGFAREVDHLLGLARETWGEEILWDAVKDLPHGPEKRTRVMAAAATGDVPRLEWLFKRGARLELKNTKGGTALSHACNKGRVNAVRALRAKGAKGDCYWEAAVDTVDQHGNTPLHIASKNGHLQVAEALLARGAAIEAKNNEGVTPLIWACITGHEDVALMLLAQGANPVAKTGSLVQPIHGACFSGNPRVVEALLKVGADIKSKDFLNYTCLHLASKSGKFEVVQMLLALGAEVDAKNKDGETPLFLACGGAEVEVARALLDHGANVNARNADRTTPIGLACFHNYTDIVRLLLSRGAKVDSYATDGDSLWRAIENRNTEIIRMLLSHGTQVFKTHIDRARGNPEILEILREAQAKQSAEKRGGGSRRTHRNKKGRTGRTKKRRS